MRELHTESDVSWVSRVSPGIKQELEGLCVLKEYRAGETICTKGEKAAGVYFLRDGRVKMSTTSIKGNEFIIGILAPPYSFGEVYLVSNSPYVYSFIAIENSSLLYLTKRGFARIRQKHPTIDEALLQTTCLHLINLSRVFDRTVTLPLEQKLASRLLGMSSMAGSHPREMGGGVVLPITQSDLASMLSTSRQSVNKILKKLEAENLISLSYHSIVLEKPEALLERANPPVRKTD